MSTPLSRLRAAADPLESLAMPLWQVTSRGEGVMFNAAYRRYTGSDQRALLGAGWLQNLHPDDSPTWLTGLHEPHAQATSVDVRLRGVDGQYRWMRVSASGDDASRLTLCAVDVDDLVSARDASTAELALQRQIFDHIPAFIVVKDTDNRILRANRFAAELLGTSAADIEGRHASMTVPQEAAALYLHDLDVLRSRQAKTHVIEAITTRRGEQCWLRLHHLPCFDATGALTRIMVVGEDITLARRFEAQLREQVAQAEALVIELEKRSYEQQLIFDHIPAVILYKDTHNRVIRASRYAAEQVGLSLDQYEGRALRDIYGERAEEFYADDLEVIRTRRTISNLVEPLAGPRGDLRWMLTQKIPLQDHAGEVTGIIVLSHDITAQKQAEDELRRQTEEMALILDHIPSMIFVKDNQNNLLRVNRAAAEAFGRDVDSLVGQPSDDVLPDPEGRFWQEDLNIMRSRKPRFDLRCQIPKDGASPLWWRYHKLPYFDAAGQAVGVVVIAEDITTDINAKQALEDAPAQARHHEHELHTLFDNLSICVVFKDCDNHILRANRFAAELFCMSQSSLVGRDIDELVLGNELDYRDTDTEVAESGDSKLNNVHELTLADGRCMLVRSHAMRCHDADGGVLGLLIAFQKLKETRRQDAGA